MEDLQILHLENRLVNSLSGGEFQKVRIARALVQNPRFILLDEPASSLDFVFEPELMEFLKNAAHTKNIGILISVHNVNLAIRFADKIMLLPKNQPVIFGEPSKIITFKITTPILILYVEYGMRSNHDTIVLPIFHHIVRP